MGNGLEHDGTQRSTPSSDLRDQSSCSSRPRSALLRAQVDQVRHKAGRMACRAAIEATSGRSERAHAMIDTIAGLLEDDPYRARIHLSEVLSGGPVSREQRRKGFYKLAQLVADLLPATGDSRQRLMLGVAVVGAADEYLRAWLDDRQGMTRNDVVDLVMLVFDSVARCLIPNPA
jgi:hypothetical protein